MDDDATTLRDGPEMLDLRGLKCPLPVLRTRRALLRLAPGGVVVVRCTDPLAGLDIPNLLRETGDALVGAARDGRETRFTIRRSRGAEERGPCGQDQTDTTRVEDPTTTNEASES